MTTQKTDKKAGNDSSSKRGSASEGTERQSGTANKGSKSVHKNEEALTPKSSKKSK